MPARRTRRTEREPARPQGRPPGSTSDATRARILAAARVCFGAMGYAGTTNKHIADRVGITAAAIYQYFDSKAALYVAAATDAEAELARHFRKAAAAEKTARAALVALVRTAVELHERDPSITAFLSALPVEMRREDTIAEAMAARPSEVVAIIDEILDRAARAGEVARADVPKIGPMFVACMMGLSLYAATLGGDLSSIVDAYVGVMDGHLLARRSPRRTRR